MRIGRKLQGHPIIGTIAGASASVALVLASIKTGGIKWLLLPKNAVVPDIVVDDRMWVPLSKDFPNLKGATDADIRDLMRKVMGATHLINDELADRIDKIKDMTNLEILERWGELTLDLIKYDYLDYVRVMSRQDVFDIAVKMGDDIVEKHPSTEGFDPGLKFNLKTIFVTTPRGGHEFLSIFAYANGLRKEQVPSDIRPKLTNVTWPAEKIAEMMKEFRLKGHDAEAIIRDLGQNNILNAVQNIEKAIEHRSRNDNARFLVEAIENIFDRGTLLRAEGLHLTGRVRFYFREYYEGHNWLGEKKIDRIRNIVIVDDIVASGQQMNDTFDQLREFFGLDVKIIPATISGRPQSLKHYVRQNAVFGFEGIGIREWRKRIRSDEDIIALKERIEKIEDSIAESEELSSKLPSAERDDINIILSQMFIRRAAFQKQLRDLQALGKPDPKKDVITVAFPWSIPDGESDQLLTMLYGSRKRKGRRKRTIGDEEGG